MLLVMVGGAWLHQHQSPRKTKQQTGEQSTVRVALLVRQGLNSAQLWELVQDVYCYLHCSFKTMTLLTNDVLLFDC